jgi:hypothetical protein
MLYTILQVGDKEYKLRLSAQSTIDVEKQLGKSVLDVLLGLAPEGMSADSDPKHINVKGISMPFVGDIVTILHGSLQKYQHGFKLSDTYALYDDYIDAGGSYQDFFGILQDILKVSGFLPEGAEKAPEAAPEIPEGEPPEA